MASFSLAEALGPQPAEAQEVAPLEEKKSFSLDEAKGSSQQWPSPIEALAQGAKGGFKEIGQSLTVGSSTPPTPLAEDTPAAQDFELGDITSPFERGLPKVAYRVGKGSPTMAAGIVGAGLGSVVPGVGTLAGGAAGAAVGAAVQAIGPSFAAELKKSPNDPDGAWTRALEHAAASGIFSGAGWAAFPLGGRFFQGPVKNFVFQALGIQPGISAAHQVTGNVISGEEPTKDLGKSYVEGMVGTAVPALGHAGVTKLLGRETPPSPRTPEQEAVHARIGEPSKDWSLPSFTEVYEAAKDNLYQLRSAEKFLGGNGDIPAEDSFYKLARLTRGSYGKAEHFLEHATFDPITGQNNGPSLKKIFEPVKDDISGFEDYAIARRAIELEGRGIQTAVPLAEAQATVQQLGPKFGQVFNGVRQFQRNTVGYLKKSGLLNDEQVRAMEQDNQDYVPFYRLMDEPDLNTQGAGAGIKARQPIKTIFGSDRKLLHPVESIIKNTYAYISLADRNLALRKMQDWVENHPRGNEIMEREAPSVRPINVTGPETTKALIGMGHNNPPSPIDDFTIFRPNAFHPEPDVIRVWNDGKPVNYRTADPKLAAAVNGLNREQSGMLIKLLSVPAKGLRAGATLTPEFTVRNLIRDQLSAFIFSKGGRGYVPVYDFAKGLGSILTKGEGYQNWLKSGGANSAMVSIDRDYISNLVGKMRDPTFMGRIKGVVKSPIDLLRAGSELVENATRVGENMRQIKRGASLPQAGFTSREITLDFQRIGSKMQGYNNITAFGNPQIEGVDRTFRSIGEHPMGFLAKVTAGITLPSIALWFNNKDDPRMQEIPRWQKDMFWIIPTDDWQPITPQKNRSVADIVKAIPAAYTRQRNGQWEVNKGNIWRVPKPFELGVIFGSVPERILDAYYEKNPNAFKDLWKSIQQAFLPNYIPTAAVPVVEQYANKSLFTDRPLVPQYLQDKLPEYQANPYTTDTAKQIGHWIAQIPGMSESKIASPIMVENYVRAWTGGTGRHALDLSDSVLKGMGVTPSKVDPALTNADRVLIKAFAVRFPESGANSIQDFYEEYDRRKKTTATVKYLQKTGEGETAKQLAANNTMVTAEGIHKAISNQFKIVRDVYRNKEMTPQQKRDFIDMSYLQIIKMSQTGNEIFQKTAPP